MLVYQRVIRSPHFCPLKDTGCFEKSPKSLGVLARFFSHSRLGSSIEKSQETNLQGFNLNHPALLRLLRWAAFVGSIIFEPEVVWQLLLLLMEEILLQVTGNYPIINWFYTSQASINGITQAWNNSLEASNEQRSQIGQCGNVFRNFLRVLQTIPIDKGWDFKHPTSFSFAFQSVWKLGIPWSLDDH